MKRRNLVIDGTSEDGTYQGIGEGPGDGKFGPFVVFDVDAQQNAAGPFASSADAYLAREQLWGIDDMTMVSA